MQCIEGLHCIVYFCHGNGSHLGVSYVQLDFGSTVLKDVESLRKEVEQRMRASVQAGKTVSSQPISLTVLGPHLMRTWTSRVLNSVL